MRSLPRLGGLRGAWEAAREILEEQLRDLTQYLEGQPRHTYRTIGYRAGEELALDVRIERVPYAVEVVFAGLATSPGTAVAGVDPWPVWRWTSLHGRGVVRVESIGGLTTGTDYNVRLRITEAP